MSLMMCITLTCRSSTCYSTYLMISVFFDSMTFETEVTSRLTLCVNGHSVFIERLPLKQFYVVILMSVIIFISITCRSSTYYLTCLKISLFFGSMTFEIDVTSTLTFCVNSHSFFTERLPLKQFYVVFRSCL